VRSTEIAAAQLALENARAGVEKWRAELAKPDSEYPARTARHYLKFHEGKVADLEAALGDEMRHIEEEAVTNNDSRHPWRVAKGPLTFGDKVYGRGQVIPDAVVDAATNVVGLINGGHIKRLPAPKATPVPPALAHVLSNPVRTIPSDPWTECRAALKAESVKKGWTIRSVGGLRHNLETVERAIRHRAGTAAHRPVDKLYDELFAE
jgi:hypothetical protein